MPGKNEQTTTQSQSSTTSPWEPAQPLLQSLINSYKGLDTSVTPGQQSALSNLTSSATGLPNFGDYSTDAIKNLFGSSTAPQVGMLQSALSGLQSNIGGTASGTELDPYSTPGFSDAIKTMTNDITNQVKGVYAGSGRSPSGAGSFAGSLGRGLTQGISPVIAAQYNQNKANQLAAANALYGAGTGTAGAITGQEQIPLANQAQAVGLAPSATASYLTPGSLQLGAANTAYQQPWANLAALLQPSLALGGMGQQSQGTGTSTTTQPQSTLSNIIGGTTAAIGMLSLLSDERAKEEIEPIGKLNDGQKVVRFKYKGEPTMRIGLLAQAVRKHEPGAVHNVGGMLMVDHKQATDKAAAMERNH